MYCDVISSDKHLLGEKPFGMDIEANSAILNTAASHTNLIIHCTSQLSYHPASIKLIEWVRPKKVGRLIEFKCGFIMTAT
jgi:predicted dehydrogenase